ncbi:hypothetical protein C7S20_11275 [Christiangramia fulva]|uniref:Uncharacterized protein n=1 Tax=Christiangramia fulva TaxID=2126553 RepID=A0A2R3Z6E0_9FLAO|nr:hypothetical protein [Christiangramia fulva]AVR45784.1 hypothetical protein C7S20_11275 [Christiangramia fulva]
MRSLNIKPLLIGFLLIFFIFEGYSQDTPEMSMEKKLYQEYKSKGVDKALKMYDKSDMKGNEYTFMSEPLNQLGYQIMLQDKDLDAAEKIFMAQIEEYPNQANPYDSYGDLLLQKGNKEKARQNFEKAVKLAADIKDPAMKERLLYASKPKLAKLNGAGNKLDFLEGTWNVKDYNFQDGNRNLTEEATVTFSKENSILKAVRHDKSGEYQGTRIIAYDAVDDEYDMVYLRDGVSGIEPSTLKMENSSPDKVVMTEKYTSDDGKEFTVKHIIKPQGNEINWEIVDLTDGADKKVAEMVFNKQ